MSSSDCLPVVMAPCKLFLNIVFRFQALESFDNMKIWNGFQFGMFSGVEVLLSDQHSLLEEMLIDSHSMCLWHKHDCMLEVKSTQEEG